GRPDDQFDDDADALARAHLDGHFHATLPILERGAPAAAAPADSASRSRLRRGSRPTIDGQLGDRDAVCLREALQSLAVGLADALLVHADALLGDLGAFSGFGEGHGTPKLAQLDRERFGGHAHGSFAGSRRFRVYRIGDALNVPGAGNVPWPGAWCARRGAGVSVGLRGCARRLPLSPPAAGSMG